MLKKSIQSTLLSFTLALILFGAGCASSNKEVSQNRNKVQKAEALIVPQVEVIESSKYKQLKIQLETARKEVERLKTERAGLLVKYTAQHYKVKSVSENLSKAENKLSEIEKSLNEESEKFSYRPKNPLL